MPKAKMRKGTKEGEHHSDQHGVTGVQGGGREAILGAKWVEKKRGSQ